MNCIKNIFFVVLLLLCNLYCPAQEKPGQYIYQDSAIMNEGVEEVPASEENMEEDHPVKAIDTVLRNNELVINRDSIKAIKYAPSFAYASNLDSMLHALQDEKNASMKVSDDGPSLLDRFFASMITQVFFWSVAGLFIFFVLYKLFFTKGFFQRQPGKNVVNSVEEDAENMFSKTDYDKLIAGSTANKNFRLATRYHYLKTLQKLTAAGAISFAADKTNFQYLGELTGKPYKKEFARLMLAYEYTWYGEFELDESKFAQIHTGFTNFNNQF